MENNRQFFNFYNHGLIRVAVGVPEAPVADPVFNTVRTIELMEKAEHERAVLTLFPELGLSAYSCDDLFQQRALLDASLASLQRLLDASKKLNLVAVIGMPLQVDHVLFNL